MRINDLPLVKSLEEIEDIPYEKRRVVSPVVFLKLRDGRRSWRGTDQMIPNGARLEAIVEIVISVKEVLSASADESWSGSEETIEEGTPVAVRIIDYPYRDPDVSWGDIDFEPSDMRWQDIDWIQFIRPR